MSDNPCIFPQEHWDDERTMWVRTGGLTLRDYFAGQALAGMMTPAPEFPASEIATDAYAFADAMLAEREKKP